MSVLLTLLILSGIVFYGYTKAKYVVQNIEEVKFALEKPQLVKELRERHASKSAELEKELIKNEPSAKDKLIEELTQELRKKE